MINRMIILGLGLFMIMVTWAFLITLGWKVALGFLTASFLIYAGILN